MTSNEVCDSASTVNPNVSGKYRRGDKPTAHPPNDVMVDALEAYSPYDNTTPPTWSCKKVKYLCTFTGGGTPSKEVLSFWQNGIHPWVSPKDMGSSQLTTTQDYITARGLKNSPATLIQPLSLLMVVRSGILQRTIPVAINKIPVTLNQDMKALACSDELQVEYLKYYIQGNIDYLLKAWTKTGTTVESIEQDYLENWSLPLPPLPEQKAIATFLDQKTAKIDQAIKIKEQQIALLKERKQIIIQQAVTRGLNPDAPMQDSGIDWIGEIPAHWEVKKVKHLFALTMDASEKNNNHELLSVYTDIGVKPRKELEERGNKASTTDGYWLVQKNDIVVNKLLAWMGAIGVSNYEGVTSPAYDILRPQVELESYFYHLLFRTEQCSSELKKHSRGIMEMRLRLYFDKFGVIEVPYPPLKEQQAITAELDNRLSSVDSAIDVIERNIESLKEYKTTLINAAVTGKIKVA